MEGFDKLQEIGSKEISKKTHIPIRHVESMLNKEFDSFQQPQFFGFLSILEREYKTDLSGLKQEFLFARAEEKIAKESSYDIAETGSKLLENKQQFLKSKRVIYAAAGGVVVLLLAGLFSMIDFSSPAEEKVEINNTAIDQAKKNLNIAPAHVSNVEEMMRNSDVESAEFGQDLQEANSTDTEVEKTVSESAPEEATESAVISTEPVRNTEPMMSLYLRIVPRGTLWVGIIDTETHRRRAETITEPLLLDAEKSWLIMTGYGHLDMDCGDTTHKYRENNKLMFLYEAGVCQLIDSEEFKARNKGKLW